MVYIDFDSIRNTILFPAKNFLSFTKEYAIILVPIMVTGHKQIK